MGQALDLIRRWQNQRIKKDQLKRRGDYLKAVQFEQTCLERTRACQKLDGVKAALDSFRSSAYPAMQVRVYDQGWSLGTWKKMSDGSQAWDGVVNILPRYDRSGQIIGVEIYGHNQKKQAPPETEAILTALTQLYFPRRPRRESR